MALFADISGAFDTVSGDAFIEAMKERGISKAILNRNKQYIGNRTAIFKVQSTSRVVSLNKGWPKGSCLLTLAWNLVFDQLLEAFQKHGVKILGPVYSFPTLFDSIAKSCLRTICSRIVLFLLSIPSPLTLFFL